jgi:phosphatidylserine/phosphatidylglycerophosphate/cardiolipin synthase-like enzyme
MAFDFKPGQTVRVTISKTITRAAARKTIQRLFMLDKVVARPLELRARNFKELPKRRGGQIWTKRPNKLHLPLNKGDAAAVKVTASSLKDLSSVEDFVQVAAQ